MPPTSPQPQPQPKPESVKSALASLSRAVERVAIEFGEYPADAFWFVQNGLEYAASMVHGQLSPESPHHSRHITGQQLSVGLKAYAEAMYGSLARTVLAKWNIHSTYDFGRIVFALIDAEVLSKQPEDTIEDFRDVFDFRRAFGEYVVPLA
jgi:uncharacterized repeat protein (TIGR04138 family)